MPQGTRKTYLQRLTTLSFRRTQRPTLETKLTGSPPAVAVPSPLHLTAPETEHEPPGQTLQDLPRDLYGMREGRPSLAAPEW